MTVGGWNKSKEDYIERETQNDVKDVTYLQKHTTFTHGQMKKTTTKTDETKCERT